MEATKKENESSHSIREEEEVEEEDEGDLFEINLEIVNEIPPPQYYYFTATTNTTLLANCLLPVADVSCAVPIMMTSFPGIGEDRSFSFCFKEMKV